ncbi:acetyltransferase (GNAT) family protein [Chryseobacterium sp. 52]|uniref:GNAT family N-acetyltransferase n=1 Tax=Chryseobacterium sp. 52 TaxID=2035213 RepID=UPI000C1A1C1A|nr:GNAT family N-acetyltransferase [Chryseobacterium sp. 52]PIF45239.1 acetyltransferase (GNAT) family protein [Chryseobacterium sp. 52]
MSITIEVIKHPSEDKRAIGLINRLNDSLTDISGSNGSKNADLDDFTQENAVFIIALDGEDAVACGGIRPLFPQICEVKRMFSQEKRKGLGWKILSALEITAKQLNYQHIYLETRKTNYNAVAFYMKNGYKVIENYGIYAENEEAVCFSKELK